MVDAAPWAQMVVVAADGTRHVVPLAGEGRPDLDLVDRLARLHLAARRAGGRLSLEEVSAPLGRLLELVGLLGELQGQPEGGQQALGVEEGMDP